MRGAQAFRMTDLPPQLPPLREVVNRHGLFASKALGQNFLFDEQLLDRIAGARQPARGERAGSRPRPRRADPRAAARRGERDRDRDGQALPAGAAELSDAFPGQLTVIEGDATRIDPATLFDGPWHVAANLPYNVGTLLFTGWLSGQEWPPRWQSLTLMFQLEVAERIVARPGTDAYGRLAVLAQWRASPVIAMKVHRSAFTPPPKVMSAIVHVEPAAMPAGVSARMLERVTEAAFGQRRKMLRQSLKGLPGALDVLEPLGIDPQRRAETLSVDEFVGIARALTA
jgi:16S rRNA (adenine1518-N6/adenine1519-N6)-dimethyltransferase